MASGIMPSRTWRSVSCRHLCGCSRPHDGRVAARLIAIRIFDPALLNNLFKTRDVLQKTFAGEAEKIIAELRILEVDLQQSVIGHGQDFTILSAFDRLRPSIVGRQEAELTHETSGRDLDAEFGH